VSDRLDIGSVELQRPPHVLPATGVEAPWWLLLGAFALIAAGIGVARSRAA
jgi:LPXTG-motif cell wall-anchored protein